MKKFIVFLILSFFRILNGKLVPSEKLTIPENEGFLVYLWPESNFGTLDRCSVILPSNQEIEIDVKSAKSISKKTPNNEKIERFSKKYCGIRLKNLSKKSTGNWTLIAEDSSKIQIKDIFQINVSATAEVPKEGNITVKGGSLSSTKVACPDSNPSRFCRIYNKQGEQIFGKQTYNCDTLVEYSKNNEKFSCKSNKYGKMDELVTNINLILDPDEKYIKSYTTKYENSFVLTCENYVKVSFCRAERPDGKQYLIDDGLLTNFYSAFDTVTSNGKCSIELQYPLRQEDIGVWRIYQHSGASTETIENLPGCVFEVGLTPENRKKRSANDLMEKRIIYDKSGTHEETFKCEVPYPIEYCYLEMPPNSGSKICEKFKALFDQTKSAGQCIIKVSNLTTGIYTCGVNSQGESEDYQKQFDVHVHKIPAYVDIQKDSSFIYGDTFHLMCKSLFRKPIKYCRFKTPRGKFFSVSENTAVSESQNFDYFGKGILEGECGIVVKELDNEDYGEYECTVNIDNKEYTMKMVVSEMGVSLASIFGVAFGIVIMVFIAVLYGGYKFNIRRNYRNAASTSRENSISISAIDTTRNLTD